MWIRNGTCMPYQSFMYKSTVFLDFFYYDTFLLQSAVVLLGAEKFMEISMRRFGFFQKWITSKSISRMSPDIKLTEDYFRFLIHILSDRTNLGFNVSQQMRRDIVHMLAIQDQTFSAFSNQINSRVVTQKEFDSILASVSNFKPGTPGTYILKDTCWQEYDPFFLRYLPQQQEK
jgi:E3 ubiquitin-protein ligase UBR1